MNRLDLETTRGRGRPGLRILVDGVESLKGEEEGFGAEALLGSGALVPTDPPRRIALYCCSCGCPGCGNVSTLVTRDGGVVRWSAFMSITGEYDDGPLPPDDDPDPLLGDEAEFLRHPLDMPDLEFDAVQYLDEVEAAARALG